MDVPTGPGGPQAAFDSLDEQIADLVDARVRCRKAIMVSRAAVAAGALTLAMSLPFATLRAPMIAFAALTAVIGGMVWAGASKSSGEDLDASLAEAEARKAALFDEIARRNGWRDLTPTVH